MPWRETRPAQMTLRGPLNEQTATKVCDVVADCVLHHQHELIIDLNGLDYLDSEGLDVLISAQRLGRRNGCLVRLEGLEQAVRRMVGLDDDPGLPGPRPASTDQRGGT